MSNTDQTPNGRGGKYLIIFGGGCVLVLCLVAVLVSLLATVTSHDAIVAMGRSNATDLTDPQLGSLYVIRDGTIVGRPVCRIELSDSDIAGGNTTHNYKFSNVVGQLLPFVVKLNSIILGRDSKDNDSQLPSNELFELEWVAKEIYIKSFLNKPPGSECAKDIDIELSDSDQGVKVCTVDRVISNADSQDTIYAIGFREKCLVSCDKGETGCPTRIFEEPNNIKLVARLKNAFGLINHTQTLVKKKE